MKRLNKKKAFAEATKTYPLLKPTRAAGFSTMQDGPGLMISCFDTDTVVVLFHPTDLSRLKSMLAMIEAKEGK